MFRHLALLPHLDSVRGASACRLLKNTELCHRRRSASVCYVRLLPLRVAFFYCKDSVAESLHHPIVYVMNASLMLAHLTRVYMLMVHKSRILVTDYTMCYYRGKWLLSRSIPRAAHTII